MHVTLADEGLSYRTIARGFTVGEAFIYQWVQTDSYAIVVIFLSQKQNTYILVRESHTPFDGNAYQIGTHFTRILCEIFIDISNVIMSSLHK
jgi:hypothetical protein